MICTKTGIENRLRRIRPEEHAELGVLDAEIEAARVRLRDLQDQRKTLLTDAFKRGHAVAVKDVRARAEAALAEGRMTY